MRPFALLGLSALALVTTLPTMAQAQQPRQRPLTFRVAPRSFLDPGPVAPVGSLNRYVTAPMISYIQDPPYSQNKERFGASVLPDPVGGPFVGARNPFADVETTGSIR